MTVRVGVDLSVEEGLTARMGQRSSSYGFPKIPQKRSKSTSGFLHDIPTTEWTVTAILAMQKICHFSLTGREKGSGLWGNSRTRSIVRYPPRSRILRRLCVKSRMP
jgi:hypothetical protein